MKHADFEELRAARLLRELTPAEHARVADWLQDHPEDREGWEADEALDALLAGLPDADVPSNFTARVWDRIDADPEREGQPVRFGVAAWLDAVRTLLPKLACAGAVMLLVAALWRRETVRERVETAESLVPVVEVAQLPSVEVLRDFDAVRSLGEPMIGGDLELLAVLEEIK